MITKLNIITYNLISFIYNLMVSTIKYKNRGYINYIFYLFISILCLNILGLIPYTLTPTSHLVITLSISISVFVSMLGTAIIKLRFKTLSLFLPSGAPIALIPLLNIIELISYIVRGVSLAIRLGANIIAGHVILKIISTALISLMLSNSVTLILFIVPLLIIMVIYILELSVAFLQAYVFTVLTLNYLNEVLNS